ncbi:amidohydrolase family protein [Promicromonospora sp. NFX87]|uniref:amidohydrolase family protein n=1 Tax=Promicromonospora sp. NFX87 TaxID=3402691 RepID=UPI003AFA057B
MPTLRNVHLIDTDSPSPGRPVDVVFEETILEVRPAARAVRPADATDGARRFLLPGLIDSHVHLGSRDALTAAARAGITTVVDLGTHPDSVIDAQRAEHGVPSILSAGSAASAPGSLQIARMGFPAASGVAGPADAARYLDWRTQHGSDLVKVIIEDPSATDVPALDVATITALVEGAHERGLLTVAHVVTAAAFDRGLDAGADILTHSPLDRPLSDATVQRMLDQKTVASPTLIMMHAMAHARLGGHAEGAFRNAVECVRAMHAAGVPIIAGTDANEIPLAPIAHGASLHDELAYLRQAGLDASDTLRAATSAAADALRLTDRGRVVVGHRADLVLVSADPTRSPEILRQPDAIWVAGTAVS